MKAGWVVTMVIAGAAPTAAIETHGFGFLDDGGNLTAQAEEIAKREFSPHARLEVLNDSVRATRIGAFGETIKADPGYEFHFVRVRVVNDGKLDLAVSTWQFSANDTLQSDHHAELGGAHDDFDGGRLSKGGSRVGTIVFQMAAGERVTSVHWEGDLADAYVDVPG